MSPVFTLNVGNTHTSLVLWRAGVPVSVQRWRTRAPLPPAAKQLLRRNRSSAAVLSGVVPAYKNLLRGQLTKAGHSVQIFRAALKPRLQIVPRPAARVGDDRIAAALGALLLAPQSAWIVIDAGTAVTVNAVTPGRGKKLPRFEGGLIFPGAALGLKALAQNTAQLPALTLNNGAGAQNFIGKNTADAMSFGVQHAEAFAAASLALRQRKLLGKNALIAVTGGRALAILRALQTLQAGRVKHLPNLVHLGLYAAWRDAQKD